MYLSLSKRPETLNGHIDTLEPKQEVPQIFQMRISGFYFYIMSYL